MREQVIPRAHKSDAATPNSEVLCGCTNLTYGAYLELLRRNPSASFEDILDLTGSGSTCTACLLDLEYHFTNSEGRAADNSDRPVLGIPAVQEIGVKQRLYRLLDRCSPRLSFRKRTWSPVLLGPGIEQWLWIANQTVLYQGGKYDEFVSPMRAKIAVLDDEGAILDRETVRILPGDALRSNLTERFESGRRKATKNGLRVGTVDLTVWSESPGMWGTTRPHFEIVTPKSACAVHTQAPGPAGRHWFTCLLRPQKERLFSVVTNPDARPLSIRAGYSLGVDQSGAPISMGPPITVPPRGAWIGEIDLPGKRVSSEQDDPAILNWHISGRHKLHLLCASKDLSRFSIDHL
ncbi:MAG: hypothetical protein QNJ92_00545 [Alphaproteobacteria bacterium]|nr:hypothetical protein [Alphaproteobacteria bacterium]